jgi:hypothetical protein
MMSITAIVENNMVKLPIDVPDGTSVEIQVPDQEPELTPDEWLKVFRELQKSVAMTPEKAAEWKRRIYDGRR